MLRAVIEDVVELSALGVFITMIALVATAAAGYH